MTRFSILKIPYHSSIVRQATLEGVVLEVVVAEVEENPTTISLLHPRYAYFLRSLFRVSIPVYSLVIEPRSFLAIVGRFTIEAGSSLAGNT